jgi:glycosyltransferase involved in cell wall biosynthesis
VHIAILDHLVIPTVPVGGCHRQMLQGLCHEHEFTVFAVDFDNPCPDRIRWVRIPAPRRPLFLLFITFYALAPFYFWLHCRRNRLHFDIVQTVENYTAFGTVSYSHFCQRTYLKSHWERSGAFGLRGMVRWLDHALRSQLEPWTYHRVKQVVVPSEGMAKEVPSEYPYTREKITIIPNPVDVERMKTPQTFDAAAFRQRLGLAPDDTVQVFVALGQFERKGLPIILEAMKEVGVPNLKLLVVGGAADLISHYQGRVRDLELQDRIVFVGMQQDVRPYLWVSDVFILPSSYETFSLVSFEAAAAGLPLMVSLIYGVEEVLCDGANGVLIERTVEGVAQGIRRFLAMSVEERMAMGARACQDVQSYNIVNFVNAWRGFYEKLQA